MRRQQLKQWVTDFVSSIQAKYYYYVYSSSSNPILGQFSISIETDLFLQFRRSIITMCIQVVVTDFEPVFNQKTHFQMCGQQSNHCIQHVYVASVSTEADSFLKFS